MKLLLAYDSLSGNTRAVAHQIRAEVEKLGHEVVEVYATIESLSDVVSVPFTEETFDLYLLGSWSSNSGRTPPEMKEFIAELYDQVGKPQHVAVFGTGETQWGAEFYCGAVKRIDAFFGSQYPRLEIEQMPHGERDHAAIIEWTHNVLSARSKQANEYTEHHVS